MTGAGRPGWWFAAAVLVLGVHLVGATTLARRPKPMPVPPAVTVIELLPPEPAAGIGAPASGLAGSLPALPQLAELPPPDLSKPEPESEPEPNPRPEPPPLPPEPEPIPAPTPPETVPLETVPPETGPIAEPVQPVAAPRPRSRPPALRRTIAPRETPEKPAPRHQTRREAPPKLAQAEPRASAPGRTPAMAATAAGGGGQAARASGQALQSWESKVRQATARHMSRARVSARGQLAATVLVHIDSSGGVQASLAQGSGDAGVDAALMRHARRLPRMPAPPDLRPKSVVVPFRITR